MNCDTYKKVNYQMEKIINYEIACLQTRSKMVSLEDKQRDIDIRDNISRIGEMTDYITAFGNSDVKLIVLPEYSINARWEKMDLQNWLKISTTIPGPYTDLLADKAKERKIWIAANMLEVHPDFPGRFFNTSCLLKLSLRFPIKYLYVFLFFLYASACCSNIE